MSKKSLSKKAVLAKGALLARFSPILATDKKLDWNAVLADVNQKNWKQKKSSIVAGIKPFLAKDADLGEIVELLDKLDDTVPDDDDMGEDEVDPRVQKILAMLQGKVSDDDMAAVQAALSELAKPPAMTGDEPTQTPNAANADPKNGENKDPQPTSAQDDNEDDDMVSKAAMDAAIKGAVDKTAREVEQRTIKRLRSIAEAEEEVRPYVGKLTAMDSAEEVYGAALKMLNIAVKDVHPSAYRHILLAQQKPGDARRPVVAQDAANVSSDMDEAFPNMRRIAG